MMFLKNVCRWVTDVALLAGIPPVREYDAVSVNARRWSFPGKLRGLLVMGAVLCWCSAGAEIPLPETYVQLEWIRSTSGGHQYINTKYTPLATDVVTCVVDVDATQNAANTWASIFGSKRGNKTEGFCFFSHSGSASENQPRYDRNTGDNIAAAILAFPCGHKTKLVCDAEGARWWALDNPDVVQTLALAATENCGVDMFVFTNNENPNGLNSYTWNTMKLYSFTIAHADGTLVRDFVPCRNANGKVGLWDAVTGEFYPNANTSAADDFHGADEIDVFVSYIQSTSGGHQYINTKYTPLATDVVTCVVDVDATQNAANTWASIFGSKYNNQKQSFTFFSHTGSASENQPLYDRDTGNTAAAPKLSFPCGCKAKLVCDAAGARWWALDTPDDVQTLTLTTPAAENCGNEMFVFTDNESPKGLNSWTWNTMKLYSFTIAKSDGTLVRDLRPYRTADGRLGVYDIAAHSGEVGYDPHYWNAGSGAKFRWGGVVYTCEDGGTTISVREGELSAFDIEEYTLVKKMSFLPVDAAAVTNYPSLALVQGKFSLRDGAVAEYHVANVLALTGGAHLALDLLPQGNDRLVVGSVDLSGASAEDPVKIDIAANGISSLSPGVSRPLIAGAGLVADDAAKFVVNGFAAEVAFVDGALVLRGRELTDSVWSGADAALNFWSAPDNWVERIVPPSGTITHFNLAAGGATIFDLPDFAAKGVFSGAGAGAFTHGGQETLSILSFATNLSENAQTFTMPMSLGVADQPFEIHTVGPLSLTGDVTTPGAFFRKSGAGTLTLDDTVVAQSPDIELVAGVTRINHTSRQTKAGVPGELRVGPGAQLDLNIVKADSLALSEPVHCKVLVLAGDGPNHEGALVNSAEGNRNTKSAQVSHIKLAGDAAIGSLTTRGARIDVNRFNGSACNDVMAEGPYTLTVNPGNNLAFTDAQFALAQVDDRGYLAFDGTATGAITNGIHVKDGAVFYCWGATVSAEIPVVFDEGSGAIHSALASTLNGPLTVMPGATACMSNNAVQVTWAGAVTNNGTIARCWDGSVVFDGALHGSGRIEGAGVKLSQNGCWYLVHGNDGWTERMVIDSSATDFLPSIRKMEVTLNDSLLPTEPLVICPCGGLTAVQAARNIVLTVCDGVGEPVPNCWLDVTEGNFVLHVADDRVVRTAEWTGKGTDPNDLTDPGNWVCRNDNGGVVEGGRPMHVTHVVVPGENCKFNCPVGSSLSYREIEFADPVSLADNCDWRGLDAAINGTVDLCGHNLLVSALRGTGTITDTSSIWQQVEYIQSTSSGHQYINTKYTPLATDVVTCVVDVDATQNAANTWASIFGSKYNNQKQSFTFFSHTGSASENQPLYDRDAGNTAAAPKLSFPCGCKAKLVCDAAGARWWALDTPEAVQTLTLTPSAAENCGNEMFVFTDNESPKGLNSWTWNTMKLYSFTIAHADGTLVRDFVPVRKLPSGEGALYDRVTGIYYENAGSNTFVAGPVAETKRFGELHFDVPGDQAATHSAVKLEGAVRLVKDGTGTLTLTMTQQTYGGGTEVAAGTLALGAHGNTRLYGSAGSEVCVRRGATFDVKAYANHGDCVFVLDGGTLQNTGADLKVSDVNFRYVRLTADSTMNITNSCGLVGGSSRFTTLDLGGHELTVNVAKGKSFWLYNSDVSAGKLTVTGDGTLAIDNTEMRGAEADFNLECAAVTTGCGCDVAGWTVGANTAVSGSGAVTIHGTYRPIGDTVSKYVLADGATLDLTGRETVLDIEGKDVTFPDDAKIYVDLGTRHFSGPLVSWGELSCPENLDSLTFKAVPDAKYVVFKKPDGIYGFKGFVIFVK